MRRNWLDLASRGGTGVRTLSGLSERLRMTRMGRVADVFDDAIWHLQAIDNLFTATDQ